MIKINLLPKELIKDQVPKKAFQVDLPKVGPKVFKIGIYCLSGLIALHLLALGSIILYSNSLSNLKADQQKLQPGRAQVERLNSEISNIEKKILPFRRVMEKRILWAKELNELSNLMTPGIWMTKLYIQKQAGEKREYNYILNIEGCAASAYGDEPTLAANFVKAIQGDQEFFRYFKEAKLGPMEKSTLDGTPIMNFKIFCAFKEKEKE